MKGRTAWILIVPIIAALGVAAFFALRPQPTKPPLTRFQEQVRKIPIPPAPAIEVPPVQLTPVQLQPVQLPPLRLPPPPREPLVITQQVIPIQNNATIDFSIGAPVVRSDGADKEALERSLREMADATKDISFPPTPKKEEPRQN